MTKRFYLSFFLLLAPAWPAADLNSRLTDKITTALKESGAPSVSVAVVKDGKLAFAQGFGLADLASHRTADVHTRYAVGSVTKQFTVAALLLLQEEGKLSLDDPVAKYFPNLTRANEITIRQLLSHTSGYEDYAPQDYLIPDWTRPVSASFVIDGWAKKPLNFEPGTKWQYSNTNFVLAGLIFEKVAGQPLPEFLHDRIFRPLGMESAAPWPPFRPEDAVAYTRFALGPPRPVGREASGWYYAAGNLAMTPSDLAKWDMAFLEKKILSPRSYEEFTRETRLTNGDLTHYALGLDVLDFHGIPELEHSGEVSGFLSSNAIYPTRHAAVVVLSNEDGVSLVGPLTRQIATILLLPEQPAASAKNTAQVRAILEDLRKGRIDRALFTDNANSYFTPAALRDFATSLTSLGKLKTVTAAGENLRGGMIHRSYRAEFAKKTVGLNVYLLPDGRFEQFMVEEQL
ncbi:MAG TPA: serine hydrolase domain-containing protein [Bryobacteraceae bacterium]|nr:serine hydrolase domain-containing protein [Bryobacteraceae bacterium]